MEILNLGNGSEDQPQPNKSSKRNKKLTAAVGLSGVAAVAGIGSTFAANISLNNGQAVEFGQGVTQTVACDSDGFSINPVTRYDNSVSKFRLQRLEITGLDLTPKGQGWDISGSGYENTDQSTAIAAHPGQYYNGSEWVNTCDGVVLDFKAYTDNSDYAGYTVDGNTSSPLYWSQYNADSNNSKWNADFAVAVSSTHNESNYGTESNYYSSDLYYLWLNYNLNGSSSTLSLVLSPYTSGNQQPLAQAINKITVESMPYFPSTYSTYSNPGVGYLSYS